MAAARVPLYKQTAPDVPTLLFLSANFESFNAFDIGPKAPDGVEK